MLRPNSILALILITHAAFAQYQGFNYGSNNADGSPAMAEDFQTLFSTARSLKDHPGFTSARLYTMIQSGTVNEPISAIPAAISTHTSLLLGMWASSGQEFFNNELAALSTAMRTYGSALTNLVAGICVGSEDLYRITPTGIENHAGVGESPEVIANYIQQTRKILAGTVLAGVKVGHVDTWTAWVNSSNIATINACDFVGVDAYPYFQTVNSNGIENGPSLFEDAYQATINAVGGRPVWITETGWPISGPVSGEAVASFNNSKFYWDAIACKYLGAVNTWWYTLYDGSSSPSFGLTGTTLSNRPVYNLRCSKSPRIRPTSSRTTKASLIKPSASMASSFLPTESTRVLETETSPSASTASGCASSLSGEYQYPHLIVPVDLNSPDAVQSSGYEGVMSSAISTLFNYDIPDSYAGKTCSVIFFFPKRKDLSTSNWTMSRSGGIDVSKLSSAASSETSYNTMPKVDKSVGGISTLIPGNSYIISTGPCSAGKTISYKVSATGGLDLSYFQVVTPSPLGLFITAC